MRSFTGFLLVLAVIGTSVNASAGIDLGLGIFKKKSKPDAVAKAKLSITTLLTDPDERKRKAAAQDLREYDPRAVPELIPALVASLQKDPIPAVRMEAVDSIGRLKPISQMAGLAMESALQSDPDPKVRDAVRAALFQYQINGYRTPPTGATSAAQSQEPPLAKPNPTLTTKPSLGSAGSPESFRPITNSVGKGGFYPQSAEPPLAKPKSTPAAAPAPTPKPVVNPSQPSQAPPPSQPSTPLPLPTRSVPQQMPSAPVPVPTTPLPEISIPKAPAAPPAPAVPSGPTVPVPPKN